MRLLFETPYIFYVLALLITSAVLVWWPEIWGLLSPDERIIRKGFKRAEQQKRAEAKAKSENE